MKNSKIAIMLIAISSLGFSFVANASTSGNGLENVEKTNGYQTFIKSQNSYNTVKSDDSVFVNHSSNH